MTTWTAVSKPNVKSVPTMSLSIVFGTPISGRPCSSWSIRVISIVCSPPIATTASRLSRSNANATRSTAFSVSGSKLDVRRIVPPSGRIPATVRWSSSM